MTATAPDAPIPESAVVVGTGRMAPGIAAALASAGVAVRIIGRDLARAKATAARATRCLAASHRATFTHQDTSGRGSGGPEPAARSSDGVLAGVVEAGTVDSGVVEAGAVVGAELVVETIVEDLPTKVALFDRLRPWLDPETIVVTNTSSLSLEDLATAAGRANRFAGLHFLNPADRTAVVEVVATARTDVRVLAVLADLVVAMGKAPVRVARPVPGFVWNRIQFAVLRECLHLLDEGVADVASIEAAVADGLAPRWVAAGPLATADLGGPALFATIARSLFGELAAGVEVTGPLGRGEAFHDWDDDRRAAVEALRVDSLAVGRELGARRRAITP